MKKIQVLWVDDDSPKKIVHMDDIDIITAKSCEGAEKLLNGGQINPEWIVVDLVVNQGSWNKHYYEFPGLAYIEHLKKRCGDKVGIIVYSHFMNDEFRLKVMKAGAIEMFSKLLYSWSSIIAFLQNQKSNDRLKIGGVIDEQLDQ
jgi:ActR/RegA family two-component response regulator